MEEINPDFTTEKWDMLLDSEEDIELKTRGWPSISMDTSDSWILAYNFCVSGIN